MGDILDVGKRDTENLHHTVISFQRFCHSRTRKPPRIRVSYAEMKGVSLMHVIYSNHIPRHD